MSALGELAVFLIYCFLSLPLAVVAGLLLINLRSVRLRHLIFLVISAIPLLAFSYFQYTNHRKAELDYVGLYQLTAYPDCEACFLELYKNNRYSVRDGQKQLESGKLKYRSGSDYFIVDIGEFGQLGVGKYQYD